MRIHFAVIALGLLCAGVFAAGQTASSSAPTCADLRLVPAPRECTAVKVLPVADAVIAVSGDAGPEAGALEADIRLKFQASGPGRDDGPHV